MASPADWSDNGSPLDDGRVSRETRVAWMHSASMKIESHPGWLSLRILVYSTAISWTAGEFALKSPAGTVFKSASQITSMN